MNMRRALFFCTDPAIDPVASLAWKIVLSTEATRLCQSPDGGDVLAIDASEGGAVMCVPLNTVLTHSLETYTDWINEVCVGVDSLCLINWHEGRNAPDNIFCAHSNGDVPAGVFPNTNATVLSEILRHLEREAREAELSEWSVLPEATHFSGSAYGSDPSVLLNLKAPLFDVEIGSSHDSWSHPEALKVLVRGAMTAPDPPAARTSTILYVGGVHFEPSVAETIVGMHEGCTYNVGHILPNQWLTESFAGEIGVEAIVRAAKSITPMPEMIVFHDNLKGSFKAAARSAAESLDIPSYNHRAFRKILYGEA